MIINKTNTSYTFTFMTFHRDGDWNQHEITFENDTDIDTNEVVMFWWHKFSKEPQTQEAAPIDFFSVGCDALKFHQSFRVENDYELWNPMNVELLERITETQEQNGYGS